MNDPSDQSSEVYEDQESPFVTAPPRPGASYASSSREAGWTGEGESDTLEFENAETEFLDSEIWTDTADQIAFRDRVLAAHIARSKARRRSPRRDLRSDELRKVPGTDVSTLPDTAAAGGRLLAAANADLARAQRAGDADALRTIRLGATSGYRGSAHQRDLWLRYFSAKDGYYDQTQAARESLPEGSQSDKALAYMLKPKKKGGFGLGGRIAAPGYSNHQAGIAIDFFQERKKGYRVANKSDDASRRRWRNTWFHRWLKANAATHGFEPLSSEEWHWEYRRRATSNAPTQTAEAYEDMESPFVTPPGGAWEADGLEVELETEPVPEAETDLELPDSELQEEEEEALEEAPHADRSGLFTFTSRILPMQVAVFVPPSARRATKVEVLVFAHGLDRCMPVRTPRPMAFVTDKPFKLGDVVEASARPMILVVPFLDWEHFKQRKLVFGQNWHAFAKPENLNGVISEALEQVATRTGSGTAPTLLRLILSGHSRAFGVLDALAKARANPEMSNGALSRLSHVWAFDTTYTSPVADWMAWLRSRADLKATVVYRHGTTTEKPLSTGVHGKRFLAQAKQSDGRLSVIPVPSGSVGHCAVPRKYLPVFLESLPAVSPTISDEEAYLEAEDECDIEASEADVEAMEEWDTETESSEEEVNEEPSLEAFGAFDESGTEGEQESESIGVDETVDEEGFIESPTNPEEQLEADDPSVKERLPSLEEEACGFETEDENYEGRGYGDVSTELETPSVTEVVFPSGESVRVVTGFPEGKEEDYWDPSGSGNPLLDTGPAHKNKKLSAKFTVGELTTSGGVSADVARIDPKLVECLQRLRDYVGKAIKITSGYRSWKRNKQVYAGRKNPDGTPTKPTLSQHCGGRAADIKISGMNGLEISKAVIEACGPNIGVGLGNTFAHIDVRGLAAAWNYGGVKDSWVSEIKRYQKKNGSTRTSPAGGGSPPATPSLTPKVTSSSGMSAARRAELIAAALTQATTAGKEDDRMAIAAALKANGKDPATWFAEIVPDATFLGRQIVQSFGDVPGVHRTLFDALKRAERTLLDERPGRTATQLGQELGIRRISGLRPPKKPAGEKSGVSFHCFGLAVDINSATNPFVGNMRPNRKTYEEKYKKDMTEEQYNGFMANRSPRIIERAMLLLRGERLNVETDFKTATGESVSKSGAGAAWDSHHRASETLAEYLRLADDVDGQRLRTLVNGVQARGDTRTLAWWKTRIDTDRSNLKNKKWDFVNHDHPEQFGYMDLPRALVVALVGAGLKWGGQLQGAKDIMHFDLREGWKRPK